MNPVPTLLTVALVWDPSNPSDIAGVLQRVEQQMDITKAFKGQSQPRSATLRGIMCQHGTRYCAVFFDTGSRSWVWFDDAVRTLEAAKESAERSHTAALSKLSVQDRQLKTFLEANEALEADLRKQMQRVATYERRKQEQEAEQQTVEAYYQARLEEMQAQYDKLLSEIDDAKRAAQECTLAQKA